MKRTAIENLATQIARKLTSKKALNVAIMDLRGVSGLCDYFVIASAQSNKAVMGLADELSDFLKDNFKHKWHMEGYQQATWVLIDTGSVIVHIFQESARHFYDLENLWPDAKLRFIND